MKTQTIRRRPRPKIPPACSLCGRPSELAAIQPTRNGGRLVPVLLWSLCVRCLARPDARARLGGRTNGFSLDPNQAQILIARRRENPLGLLAAEASMTCSQCSLPVCLSLSALSLSSEQTIVCHECIHFDT